MMNMIAWRGHQQGEAQSVRLFFLAALMMLAAAVDHAWLSQWPAAPDISLALAAWAMVDGDEDGVIWRALIAGMAREVADPIGGSFHLITLLALAIAFLTVRRFFFRTRAASWAMWAAIAYLFVRSVDGVYSGFGDYHATVLLSGAFGTAGVAVICGWLFGGLPAAWRPIPASGA